MQTLRPFSQDENELGLHQIRHKAAPCSDGENAFAQPRGKGQERNVAFKGTPGVTATRRALGNITNQKGAGLGRSRLDGTKTGGKTPGVGLTVRRALGDITNATPARELASSFQEAAPALSAGPGPQAEAAARTVSQSQIDAWAEGGVERRAGKSWARLEADRAARGDAEMDACLSAALNFPPPRMLRPRLDSLTLQAMAASEPVEDTSAGLSCPASPTAPASPTRTEDGDAAWRADLNAALSALPELDSHSPMKAWNAAELRDEDDVSGPAEAEQYH